MASVSVNDERSDACMAPERHKPPKEHPPAEYLQVVKYNYHWNNVWRYVIVQPSVKNTGLTMATWSNKDGTSIYPGIRRLAIASGHSKRAVIEALAWMRWLGFVWRVSTSPGSESHEADSYVLCLPRDMTHVPRATPKPLKEPVFAEMPPIARHSAMLLGVAKRLGAAPGDLMSPGVVTSGHHRWWSQVTPPTHLTNSNDHAAENQAGSRASSRAAEDSFAAYDLIDEAVGGLDPVESSTVDGMLADGRHPNAIINRIRTMREAA